MSSHSQTIPKIRVAVAEDDPDCRAMLVEGLRDAGFAVTEAHDGGELLELLQSTAPGFFRVVVTDQRMPRLDGVECLARAGARAPFIIVSGENDPGFHEAAAKFGAAAVLQKPVQLSRLIDAVMDVLQRNLRRSPTHVGGAA